MQLGDPKAAGAAFDILSDYFSNHYSQVKESDKRYGKRRQHRAEPLVVDNSPSSTDVARPMLEGLDGISRANSVLSDLSVTPILMRKQSQSDKYASGISSNASLGSQLTSTSSEKRDLNVADFHNVADLVHRLTQRTGLQPGQARVTKTPDSVVEKAHHMADLQYKELRYSNRMQQILAEVMDVSTRLGEVVKPIAGHRRDLGRAVEESNTTYLRLFESMMSEILLIHRKKFKSQTKELIDLRTANDKLDAELEQSKLENGTLRSRLHGAELEHDKLRAMLRARDKQVTMLSEEIERLDEIRRDYMSYLESVREINAKGDRERAELEARLRAEEQAALKAQLAELQLQFMRTQAMLRDAQENARTRDMANKMESQMKKKIPTDEASSQTEFTDFNIFDKQDGWILPISGTAAARINWRRALNFATCPACRGVGKQVMATAVLLKRLIRGEGETKARKRGAGIWNLPDEICQFVSNLPRHVMAHRPYALSWTVNRITHIFMAKTYADEEDTAAGHPVQSLEQFIIERYLMLTEERGEAEEGIHRLLQSVKEHHKRHSLLHTFARFMYMLQDDDAREGASHEQETPVKKKTRRKSSAGNMAAEMAAMDEILKPTPRDLPISVLSVYLFAREHMLRPGYVGAYAEAIARAKANGNGDLLKYQSMIEMASSKPPKFVNKEPKAKEKRGSINKKGSKSTDEIPSPKHSTIQASHSVSASEEDAKEGIAKDHLCDATDNADMGKKWGIGSIESHVCVFSNFSMWIPLDRAIEVVNEVLNFLTDAQLLAVSRRIEHISAFLTPQGNLSSADGNHTEIRQHMRAFLPSSSTDAGPSANYDRQAVSSAKPHSAALVSEDGGVAAKITAFMEAQRLLEPTRQYTVMVNLDDALQTISEMLLTRISHMEEKLGRIFYEGDTNGDGILSYQEFLAIVNRIAPHFTSRRILSMYREVLLMGEDSEKIELPSFVAICKKYGLVKLVDLKAAYERVKRRLPSASGSSSFSLSVETADSVYDNSNGAKFNVSSTKSNSSIRRIESIPEDFLFSDDEIEIPEDEQLASNSKQPLRAGNELATEVEEEEDDHS